MRESWRPFVALIESFGELLTLARQATSRGTTGGSGVDSGAVGAAVARLRDALVEASDIDLLSVRLYHKSQGGFITRVIPRRHATQSASYSDEASDLTEEQLARMVGQTSEYYLGDPEELEPELVVRHWAEIAHELATLNFPEASLCRLIDLVREEHRAAPAAPPVLPLVYRAPGETSTGRRGARRGPGEPGTRSTRPSPSRRAMRRGARPTRSSSSPGSPPNAQ